MWAGYVCKRKPISVKKALVKRSDWLILCPGALNSLCVCFPIFQLACRTPALVSACILASKHSSECSIWQAFIVLVAFLLLSDGVSKHIGLAAQAICVFCPCSFQFLQWNIVCQIALAFRSNRWAGVSYGCYCLTAACLKYCALFVFPGGFGLQWLYTAVVQVVGWLRRTQSASDAEVQIQPDFND